MRGEDDVRELAARLHVSDSTARRYLRGSVQLPDGRHVFGSRPGMAGGALEEHRLRDRLAAQLGGITEAVLPFGRADVMTGSLVFEVESRGTWRTGVRQALAYSAQCGLPPALALFGAIRRDDLLKLYMKLRDGRPPVALWWWTGYGWDHISSRRACRSMKGTPR